MPSPAAPLASKVAAFAVALLLGLAVGLLRVDLAVSAGIVVLLATVAAGLRWPQTILALFLTAGAFKAVIPTPFDLSVLFGIVVVGLVLLQMAREREFPVIPRPLLLFAAVAFLILAGIVHSPAPEYGLDKALRFATMGMIAVFAPLVLVRREGLLAFMHSLAGVGVALSVHALLLGGSPAAYGRYVAAGSDTIWLGRAAGIALLAGVAILAYRRPSARLFAVVAGSVSMIALVGSGSRGPVAAVVVAVGSLLVLRIVSAGGHKGTVALAVVLVTLTALLAWQVVPEVAIERLARVFTDDPGQSALTRLRLLIAAAALTIENPLVGVGTGGFASVEPLLRYPHNLFLELSSENGILVAGLMAVLLSLAVVNAARTVIRNPGDVGAAFVLMALVFGAANALVSSDINGHRLMYCFIPLALASDSAPDSNVRFGRRDVEGQVP